MLNRCMGIPCIGESSLTEHAPMGLAWEPGAAKLVRPPTRVVAIVVLSRKKWLAKKCIII